MISQVMKIKGGQRFWIFPQFPHKVYLTKALLKYRQHSQLHESLHLKANNKTVITIQKTIDYLKNFISKVRLLSIK
jgi:hypothetical protein